MVAPSRDEREAIVALGGERGFAQAYGLRPGVEIIGDDSAPIYERLWRQPAVTVVGFDAHPIAGSSNQIVSECTARLSFRLAPGQDPAAAMQAVDAHIARHVPWGLECVVDAFEGSTDRNSL